MRLLCGILSGFLCLLCLSRSLRAAEDLQCLTADERAQNILYEQLQRDAYAALDRRQQTYEALKTPEQIATYQKRLRKSLTQQLGGFPERTPLNARTVRTLKANGYRVELVIFESQPHHHVTANLYLPNGKGPFPGVAVSSGHSRTGKTAAYNQRFAIALASHGIAALCFDPIGQGERSQILSAQGKPVHSSTTREHFLIGVGSILVGRNTARYRVWDAMRALDYLASRPEIDKQKLGMTGCSGGGTLTSYTMALDSRIACAAPACYLTTFRRLIETIGPQDAEQNIFGQLSLGIDQPDYVLLRAPRPTLISSTTNDFFDIQGSWTNYRQAKRIYGRLGFPERVDLVEIEGKHGVKPQNLATIVHWFQRWLLDRDAPVKIRQYATRPPADLLCTPKGQVLRLADERSVFQLNQEYDRTVLAAARTKVWKQHSADEMREKIRQLAGIAPSSKLTAPQWVDRGRLKRDEYHIDRLVLRTASGAVVPGLTWHPPAPLDDAYLLLHDRGKLGGSEPDGRIESLIQDGYAVVTVDLRGQGETTKLRRDPLLGSWKTYYLAYLLGRPLLGMQVEDAHAAAHFVAYYQKKKNDPRKVHLVGVGQAGIVALHTAALYPKLFTSVTLRDVPASWASILGKAEPRGQLDATVHAALTQYDLPDLVRLVGRDKVRFEPAR